MQTENDGVLAHLARAFDWQSKGNRFDSDILHEREAQASFFENSNTESAIVVAEQKQGVLAQLVERLVRNQKVTGSTPVYSTTKKPPFGGFFIYTHILFSAIFNYISGGLKSLSALATVAIATKHLAVVGCGAATLTPRGDVVALHLLYLEVLITDWADTLLTLVNLATGVLVKGS